MKEIKNQRGFATLEIILAVTILGIFSAVAVPNMARILDKVCLDYEMKHLYSDLNLARSIGKSSTFSGGIFTNVENNQQKIEFWIYSGEYTTVSARNRYQIMRPSIAASPYYRHNLTNGVMLEFYAGEAMQKITFNNRSRYDNWSKTLELTVNKSKNKIGAQIKFDSVGRWRGEYVK